MRAAKQSEMERWSKQYRRNHAKQCKLFMSFNEWEQAHKDLKKKKRTFAWSITYLNEWKHFCRHFLLLLQCLFFSLLINSYMLFEFTDCYINRFFDEIKLKKENLKIVFWVPEFGCPNWYTWYIPNSLVTSLNIRSH